MLKSYQILLAVVLTVVGCAKGQTYAGPNALGPFRIDKDFVIKQLFDRLGRPPSSTGDVFCYRSSHKNGFLVLTRMTEAYDPKIAGTATLSEFRNCLDKPVLGTTENLAMWKTGEGVGLGSTADEVRKAYGNPSKEDKIEGTKYRWVIHGDRKGEHYTQERRSEIGDTVLVYQGASDDLRIAEFGIRAGKVVWISLSKNE